MDEKVISLATPWRVVKNTAYYGPRIVDVRGHPVASFANQIRWRGEAGTKWAWAVVKAIVAAVNGRQFPATDVALRLPWQVIENKSYYGPRIIDCDGRPVTSFANQIRWRPDGTAWAWATACAIVTQVNSQLKHPTKESLSR